MQNTLSKFDLSGKTAFVTGGGTGLGYYISRGLSALGARVMIASRRQDVLHDAASELTKETGNEVSYHPLDLSDRNSIAESTHYAVDTLGGVDIYVGNAALDAFETIDKVKDEDIDAMLQVNVAANIALVRGFLPHMKQKRWGRVIFSSSVASTHATVDMGMSVYGAAKGGLNAFARYGAAEWGRSGITFNNLVIGMYHTDMLQTTLDMLDKEHGPGSGEKFIEEFAVNTAVGRIGNCDELEGLVQLLASDAGAYITGTSIPVDGGLSIMMRPEPL